MSDYEFHGNKEIRLSISVVDDLASSGFQLWADHRFGDEEEAIAVRDALCERFGVPEPRNVPLERNPPPCAGWRVVDVSDGRVYGVPNWVRIAPTDGPSVSYRPSEHVDNITRERDRYKSIADQQDEKLTAIATALDKEIES